MITTQLNSGNVRIMNILNPNVIQEDRKKAAIKAMGLSSCQVGCISRNCYSKCHGGGHK